MQVRVTCYDDLKRILFTDDSFYYADKQRLYDISKSVANDIMSKAGLITIAIKEKP